MNYIFNGVLPIPMTIFILDILPLLWMVNLSCSITEMLAFPNYLPLKSLLSLTVLLGMIFFHTLLQISQHPQAGSHSCWPSLPVQLSGVDLCPRARAGTERTRAASSHALPCISKIKLLRRELGVWRSFWFKHHILPLFLFRFFRFSWMIISWFII